MISTIMILILFITLYCYVLAIVALRPRVEFDHYHDNLFFILIIPALNEEQVIARTLSTLLMLKGNLRVLIVDDASDDATVQEVQHFLVDPRVLLLIRSREEARRGKGDSLNAAYQFVQQLDEISSYNPHDVIITIFDADARVEPHFIEAVTPYFNDPKVAGVQCAVRMFNANHNFLTMWQHLEFTLWGWIFCRAKDRIGSTTLGGNGQCVRLSALRSLEHDPWASASLTEDLDLSLRLLVKGWRLRFCQSVAVWQEALPGIRRLVRQRSRWMQGHLVCWQYVPQLMRAALPLHTSFDLLIFLLLPITFIPIGIASLDSWIHFWFGVDQLTLASLLVWYSLGFAVTPLAAFAWKQSEAPSLLRVLFYSHLFVLYSFVWLSAGIVACWNILLGKRSWAKTSRITKEQSVGFPLTEATVTDQTEL